MSFKGVLAGAAVMAVSLGMCTAASARDTGRPDPVAQGPAPIQADLVSPYADALSCVSTQLTPDQRKLAFGVAYFADRTGKEAYAPENASGKFLSQGTEDMLMTSLHKAGVTVVELNAPYRAMMDWVVQHQLARFRKEGLAVNFPDVIISGSFDTLDFIPGHTDEVVVSGIGGGINRNSVLVKLDARATWMPGTFEGKVLPAGQMVTGVSIAKRVVGYENKFGLTSFFGGRTLFELNVDHAGREPLQYMQSVMLDLTAYQLVSDTFHITACQAQREYGDALVAGDFSKVPAASNGKLASSK